MLFFLDDKSEHGIVTLIICREKQKFHAEFYF